jgi:hypothetical protein
MVARIRVLPDFDTSCSRETVSALPGCRGQPGKGRELTSVAEVPEEPLRPEGHGGLRTNNSEPLQNGGRGMRGRGLGGKECVALRLHCPDLFEKELQAIELPADPLPQGWGEGSAVAGSEYLQALPPVSPDRLAVGDALREKQALDAVHMRHPLCCERPAFAADLPAVFRFGGRCAHHGADPRLATLVGQQRAHECLAVNPVSFGPRLAWLEMAIKA